MFARTERLTLRPGWIEDAPALTHAIAHVAVVTKLAHVPWPYTLRDAEDFLKRTSPDGEAVCVILAHDAGQSRLIGCVGVHIEDGAPSLGYWLAPAAWGRGFATEAGHAMLGIARYGLGHSRLSASHHIDNPASGHVLRKLGFRATGGVERRDCRARGRRVASAIYTLDFGEEDSGPARMAA